MSIRERAWTTSKGVKKSTWIVDYFDQGGKRHQKTFTLKRDAKAFESQTHVEVMDRIHVADADTITIAEAGALAVLLRVSNVTSNALLILGGVASPRRPDEPRINAS